MTARAVDQATVDRLVQQAVDQGLPRHVEDERALNLIAGIVRSADVPRAKPAAA